MKLFKQILLFLFIIFLLSSLLRNIFDYKNKYQFFLDYKKEYEKEKKRNIELQTEIVKKKSLTELEKTIRNKLNLLRPNEVVIIIPTPTTCFISPTPTSIPVWKQWLMVFLNN